MGAGLSSELFCAAVSASSEGKFTGDPVRLPFTIETNANSEL